MMNNEHVWKCEIDTDALWHTKNNKAQILTAIKTINNWKNLLVHVGELPQIKHSWNISIGGSIIKQEAKNN